MEFLEFGLSLAFITFVFNIVASVNLKRNSDAAKLEMLDKVPTTNKPISAVPPPPPTPESVQVILYEGTRPPKPPKTPSGLTQGGREQINNVSESLDAVHKMLHEQQGTQCQEDF